MTRTLFDDPADKARDKAFRAMDGRMMMGMGRLYLWLNCEGWVRFGPFEWLAFNDEQDAIQDQHGAIVARRGEGGWVVGEAKYANYRFCHPVISSRPVHPDRYSCEIPVRARESC